MVFFQKRDLLNSDEMVKLPVVYLHYKNINRLKM